MANNDRGYSVMPIRGLDQRHNAKPQTATVAHDLTWDERDAWKSGPGFRQAVIREDRESVGAPNVNKSSPFDTMGEVTSIHWFAQHNGGVQWLVFETAAGDLRYFNGSLAPTDHSTYVKSLDWKDYDGTTAGRSRHVQTTPWPRTQSQAFNNRLYMVNGYNEPLVFDGWKAGRAGFANPPPAPTAEVVDFTAGTTPAKKPTLTNDFHGLGYRAVADPAGGVTSTSGKASYRYKMTFVNERGQESPASEPSGIVSFTNLLTERYAVHVQTSTGGDHVVARRLYRTQNLVSTDGEPFVRGDAALYYFLTEIQDNVSVVVVDYKPDVELASVLVETDLGAWPAGASLIANFKNTMFLGGTPDGRIHFSRPGLPEVFPVDNTFDIGNKVSGAVTGFLAASNALIVFKTRGIFLIKGDPLNGFFAQTLTWNDGCSSPNSITEVPGVGAVFLSTEGEVLLLEGALENVGARTRVLRLSTPIPDEMEKINRAAIVQAFGSVNRRDREFWLAIPTLGSVNNNRVLCYHYDVGQWTTKEGFPIGCMVETGDHRSYLIFGSWDITNAPGLHVIGHGFGSKQGKQGITPTAIAPRYRSATLEVQSVFNTFEVSGVRIYALGFGRNKIRTDVFINGFEIGVYEQGVNDDLEEYNEEEMRHSTDDETSHTYYNETVWDESDAIWKSHHAVVVRHDIATMAHEPIQELAIDLAPQGVRWQVIGWELLVRDAEKRDVTPLSSVFGQDLRR